MPALLRLRIERYSFSEVPSGKGKVKNDGTVTPVDVKAGDKVLFGKYSGQEITIDGTECFITRE